MTRLQDVLDTVHRLERSGIGLDVGVGFGRGAWALWPLPAREAALAQALDTCSELQGVVELLRAQLVGALRELRETGSTS